MIPIFILTCNYNYEHQSIVGVYDSKELAEYVLNHNCSKEDQYDYGIECITLTTKNDYIENIKKELGDIN